jgi:hypothetical protein
MKNDPPKPTPDPEDTQIQERILGAVHQQQLHGRWLAGLALMLGLVSIAASIGIVSFYFVFYRPKEKQLLRDLPGVIYNSSTNAAATQTAPEERVPRPHFDPVRAHLFMTFVIGVGTALVAGSVGLLGLGTLLVVTLVLLNRRVTLRQINASLADISLQLKELRRTSGP